MESLPPPLPVHRFCLPFIFHSSHIVFQRTGQYTSAKRGTRLLKKEDIDIRLTDGTITISGEKKKEDEVKRKDYYKLERSYGSFCRSFELPAEVQKDKVKSTFKDGILEIRMPKSPEAIRKEVKIQVQ